MKSGVVVGTKTFRARPSFLAAKAAAKPALPPEEDTKCFARFLAASRHNAPIPRNLNEPVGWQFSSFRKTSLFNNRERRADGMQGVLIWICIRVASMKGFAEVLTRMFDYAPTCQWR